MIGKWVTILLAAASTQAQSMSAAQAAAVSEEQGTLAEVIVTAQRRTERLQDVPIAISALGADQLARIGASDLSALRGSVPGLTVSTSAGINASNLVSIRGVGGLAVPIGTSQATAFYVDGVYLSRPDAAFFTLDDVERIEVLRGPQGTLYGRNATAGAINIITRTPGEVLKGGFDVSAADYDTVTTRGSLSGPITGTLSAGISASYDEHDGYYKNTVTGNRLGDAESYTVRGKLRHASSDDSLVLNLTADLSRRDAHDIYRNQFTSISPPATFVGITNPEFVSLDAITEPLIRTTIDGKGLAFTATYQPNDDWELTSISAYRQIETYTAYDVDGTPAPAVLSALDNRSKTLNQEIRSVYTGQAVRATIGLNYYHEEASVGLSSTSSTLPIVLTSPYTETEVDAYGVFGQLEYDLTDALTLVGGLRFNYETRDFLVDYTRAVPTPGNSEDGNLSDSVWIPSAGVNYKLTPDVLLYAKVSRGYQAPGYAAAGLASAPLVNTFGSETLTAYEGGVKSQFFGRRVTVNLAAFYYDYSDLQVRSVFSVNRILINNAASSSPRGVEASLSFEATEYLSFSGQATYLDATYSSFCEPITAGSPIGNDPSCGDGLADRSGNRLNQAPEWSGGVNINFHFPIGDRGDLIADLTYAFENNIFFTSTNDPLVSSGGWNRVDARIGFPVFEGAELYVFGKNLQDERYISYAGRAAPLLVQTGLNDPRNYGLGFRYHF